MTCKALPDKEKGLCKRGIRAGFRRAVPEEGSSECKLGGAKKSPASGIEVSISLVMSELMHDAALDSRRGSDVEERNDYEAPTTCGACMGSLRLQNTAASTMPRSTDIEKQREACRPAALELHRAS